MENKIKCGRCNTEFNPEAARLTIGLSKQPISCPLCGYSAQDVKESKNESKQVLKG